MNTTVNSTARSTGKKKADAPRALTLKPVHMRKLAAIIDVKSRALFSKNFIIMPVFSLGFTFLMQVIYEKASGGMAAMNAYALAMGMLMNVSMMGFYCTAASLAEEKEKNTLRTLMTSSVNGLEFFLGSLIPIVLMTEVVNVLCVFIAHMTMDPMQWAAYLAVTTAASVIASVIGMLLGIFSKNQVTASTLTTPVVLVFMMVPMFTGFSETLQKISMFFFTGIAFDAIANIANGLPAVDVKGIAVLAAEFILSVILFLILYRRNGFER